MLRFLLACSLFASLPLHAQDQHLLLNYSTSLNAPQQTQDMMSYVRDTFGEANRKSRLKVGLAIIYTPKEQVAETAARLRADLALAEQMNVPVLIQVDTDNWLPESLTNQPASLPRVSVWSFPRSAVSSCLSSP